MRKEFFDAIKQGKLDEVQRFLSLNSDLIQLGCFIKATTSNLENTEL